MEDNKLIAEFMGFLESPTTKKFWTNKSPEGFGIGELVNLKFDTDWNWLMEVVDKINNTGRFEVIIQYGFCYITDGLGELTLSLPEKNTIYAVHKAVVEFIKWYNENNR